MPLPERGYPSPPEEVMIGIVAAIEALRLDGLGPGEVAVRSDWKTGKGPDDAPFDGVTVSDGGEQLTQGVIGKQEVAYVVAVTNCVPKDNDSTLKNDRTMLIRSNIRRRFHNRRIPVGDLTMGTQKHVCIVKPGRPRIPLGVKFDQYDIDQLLILAWVRELPDEGE